MAFSNDELGEIDHIISEWCLAKVPVHLKSQIDYDYEIDGQAVTLFEVRPVWRGQPGEINRHPVARFRYVKSSELWNIYWMRQNGKWHSYKPASAQCSLEDALHTVETDGYGCFFG